MSQSLTEPPTIKWSDLAGEECYSSEQRAAMQRQFESADGGTFDRMRLNVRPDPVDYRDIYYQPTLIEVPPHNHAQNILHPHFRVRRQGSEGSCTGQALAAVLDLQNIKRYMQGADVPLKLSARMAYESAKIYDDHPDDGLPGSSLRGAVKGFYHCGLCDDRKAPYIVGDVMWELDKDVAKDARAVILGAYFRLRHVLNHYHTAIAEVGAILCSAMIHEGWSRRNVRENDGKIILPQSDNGAVRNVDLIGGHAFAIVGYDQEGFLVLNSRSRSWGKFNPVAKHKKTLTDMKRHFVMGNDYNVRSNLPKGAAIIDGEDTPLPGVAHWSYDDWARNVLDAWVLRLTAPTRKNAAYGGGYHVQRPGEQSVSKRGSHTPRSRDAFGHFIHMRGGVLVNEPPYDNTLTTFRETARILRAKRDKYKHLLFYAHGGLDTIEAASERCATLAKTFKANDVYPIFFFWRTGFAEMVQEVLRGLAPRIAAQTNGNARVSDHLLERLMNPIGSAIWRDIRENAYDCFAIPSPGVLHEQESRAGAWKAVKMLLDAVRCEQCGHEPMKVHYAGHGSGIFLLQGLAARIGAEKNLLIRDVVDSISLFAPACTIDELARFQKPITSRNIDVTLYTLPEGADAAADISMEPYRKSLLHLVSNSFHDTRNTRIAGLRRHWEEAAQSKSWMAKINHVHIEKLPAADAILSDAQKTLALDDLPSDVKRLASEKLRHAAFDNIAEVMNHMLANMIGIPSIDAKGGGFRNEDLQTNMF